MTTVVLVVLTVTRWVFILYLLVDLTGDMVKRWSPAMHARSLVVRAWLTWPFVFVAAPVCIAYDVRTMVTGPSFWRVSVVLLDGWVVWYAWKHRDDDDPWKRAGKRIGERVAQVGHRLVVVPVGGRG